MSQWQPGFQYPMQTGFPGGNQFQQNPQFQPQNLQFQPQGGLGILNGAGLVPQPTGFPGQRPQAMMQTGIPPGSSFMQPQATGYPGGNFQQSVPPVPPLPTQFQQSRPPPVPPVPSLPAQFQQNQPSFLNAPPQPNRLLSASPGFGGGLVPQQTGFPGQQSGGMLMPQMTGFVDPRLQMMSQSFMPMNTSAGVPQLQPQPQNLVQSFQQHNQAQRGATTQQVSWALTKAEKKSYDNIFRQWVKGERFMSGPTAIEVFGASGLSKDDLARIWTLADIDDRGKLNLEEFHVAMGLIYRRLNGMQLPDQLPHELIPSSRQDLGDTVDRVKELLERETRTHSPSSADSPISILKNRSFYGAAPSFESNRDATIYKHTDEESTSVYKPKWRHVDRDAIRSRDDDDNPTADLKDLKRRVANTAQMLDRTADADAQRTKEDEELAREMSDLNYRVKRIQEDLEFNSRGTQTASRSNERRRLERELLSLMHERIPEVERKIKDREERKEREKRQWARDRDNTNERFGRYDNRDDYSRREDRNRPYSRGEDHDTRYDDRNRSYSRADDRPSSRTEDKHYSRDVSDREDRDARDRSYDHPRSPPPTRSAPRQLPATAGSRRDTPPVQTQASPSPSLAAMTPEQRKAYTQEQAKLRIQERMTKLGVISPSTSSTLDTSVEDRLQQEKKEAEEKAKAAEKQAEERERARRERLENAKALKEGRSTPGVPTTPTPTSTFASAPVPKPPAPTPTKTAPPPPKPRARNAPPPPVRAPVPTPSARPSVPVSVPKIALSVPQTEPEVDPEEAKLRAREEAVRKAREEREKARQEMERKLKEMEEEEERARQEREREVEEQERARQEQKRVMEEQERARQEQKRAQEEREKARQERERALRESEEQEAAAARLEEEQFQQRLEALKAKSMSSKSPISPAITSPPTQAISSTFSVPAPSTPAQSSPSAQILSPGEKSTNPFSRLLKEGGTSTPTTPDNGGPTSPNPWAKPLTTPISIPSPSRSPAPISAKTSYQTAPSSAIDDDWEDIKEKGDDDDDDDSSDSDELMTRSGRADIAQALFGNIRRPTSATPSSPAPTSSPPVGGDSAAPPPPPPPPALVAPPPPAAVLAPIATPPAGRNALFAAIQGGKALRPTKTADKSGPPLSGKVLGDSGPPSHINAIARAPSPPVPSVPALIVTTLPETPELGNTRSSKSDNRQSVGWFSERAADLGGSPVIVEKFPSTFEVDELNDSKAAPIPDVLVNGHPDSDSSLMADIDKSTVYRVRSLYDFEGEGKEDLSFAANVVITANPSKSGGDWWYGTLVTSGKSGLLPKTWVEVIDPRKARAVFSYTASKSDELSFTEGDTLDIVDTAEEEWWKAERGGEVFMVPAGYLELVEVPGSRASMNATTAARARVTMTPINQRDNTRPPRIGTADSDSSSEYHSFDDDDDDDGSTRATRERERQLVLEAAGLIVQTDVGAPLRRRSTKRRPAPPAPDRHRGHWEENSATAEKDLPPVPSHCTTPEPELSYEARLDDAFARYEAFKNRQVTPNRLSVVSVESSIGATSSLSSSGGTASNVRESEGGRYSTFLNFLRSKTPDIDAKEARRKSASTWNISAPIIQNPTSVRQNPEEEVKDTDGASFGVSWTSLVDKTVLDEIPARERKRQESIFELINTEIAYVRDLQLIVEVFYSTILPLLSTKEITVVFANIEDILLTNTAFLSSLEKHQKECRLYIDKIGGILLSHIPNLGVYMEYCVNQSVAIKMLQSVRESKPELAIQLQRIRDDNPAVRNLDLSSYLLIPMQRITRYPLLIKQILQYTDVGKEQEAIFNAREMAESLLNHINETIRDQENQETLRQMSEDLWIGHSRLDLTGATRNMGTRRLLKEGVLFKAKSGRRLRAFLCSDILLLTDDGIKVLYRLPIQLAYAHVKESSRSRDETGFQIVQQNPRNGETVSLRASTPRECQQWIQEISQACKKARQAEERAGRLLTST